MRRILSPAGLIVLLICQEAVLRNAYSWPLRVHPSNPLYFTDGSGKALYLTGSHTWNNFQETPSTPFDFGGYLDFMREYRHNFIRMWSGKELIHEIPPVYVRTGPGKALDGNPKADLSRLNRTYFELLRARVSAAQQRGIHVSVMLFHGDNVLNEGKNRNWPNHPFHRANNINGINGDPNGDGAGLESHTLRIPEILSLQSVYVRKVIDALNDLDNVLYEISNEEVGAPRNPDNTAWQYHWIHFIKNYEARRKAKQHPVIMTAQWPADDANIVLFSSPADAISPAGDPYRSSPPAGDGKKVIIADVDHIWPSACQAAWIWKSFTRGLQPILMDWYQQGDPRWISGAEQERMRRNMGYTLAYANRISLQDMRPRPDLASSGYCLAHPGKEYLIYLPARRRHSIPFIGRLFEHSVTVDLSEASGVFRIEWFNPVTGERMEGGIRQGGSKRSFTPPFAAEVVLYLRKR